MTFSSFFFFKRGGGNGYRQRLAKASLTDKKKCLSIPPLTRRHGAGAVPAVYFISAKACLGNYSDKPCACLEPRDPYYLFYFFLSFIYLYYLFILFFLPAVSS